MQFRIETSKQRQNKARRLENCQETAQRRELKTFKQREWHKQRTWLAQWLAQQRQANWIRARWCLHLTKQWGQANTTEPIGITTSTHFDQTKLQTSWKNCIIYQHETKSESFWPLSINYTLSWLPNHCNGSKTTSSLSEHNLALYRERPPRAS